VEMEGRSSSSRGTCRPRTSSNLCRASTCVAVDVPKRQLLPPRFITYM